ncbi:type II secretion system F family protein [Methanothermococcus okinawensis]|uniref:Type II secretion system F domain protein n=1 Tax=Methanothermococcus okinawensis (strain DSM 14208 / JCM 11175 / IH1) TaxID=647113 RepID=F8AM14_METOI|nr:type II secretion system F family protein [Methanothermococcus okinawensis]AEH06691.1 Type II secretion system F domain protein [Methanothermococcus okinawensis IH1]
MVNIHEIYNYTIKRNIIILKRAGINLNEKSYFIIVVFLSFILPIVLKYIMHLSSKSTVILIVLYSLSILSIPSIMYESKIEKFERNLPKALYVMILSLESGRSVIDAINEVINSGIKEVDVIFLKIVALMTEKKLSFEDSIILVSNSIDSKIFRQIGRLIIENRKHGGELAEVLKTLAKTLEDLQNLKNQLLSVTANGLAVGLIIICGVIPATAGIIGGYLNAISQVAPNIAAVTPEQLAKCMENVQIGTGIFGILFAVPIFGLKVNRMIITCAFCMTFGLASFYGVYYLAKILF